MLQKDASRTNNYSKRSIRLNCEIIFGYLLLIVSRSKSCRSVFDVLSDMSSKVPLGAKITARGRKYPAVWYSTLSSD